MPKKKPEYILGNMHFFLVEYEACHRVEYKIYGTLFLLYVGQKSAKVCQCVNFQQGSEFYRSSDAI